MKSVLAVLACGVASATPATMKVVKLLGELKTKTENDLQSEGAAMEEYTEFCDDEARSKEYAIKTATREIEGHQALIQEANSQISVQQDAVEKGGGLIAAKQKDLDGAKSVRKAENGDFNAAEKELVDTVDTLARAITILKREMSFLQGGKKDFATSKMRELETALGAIIDSAWINTEQKQKVRDFMQEDDELSLKQPQAHVKNYENHGGNIVSAIEDMKDKAEESLAKLRKEEINAKHAYELLAQSLTDAIANAEKEVARAQELSHGARETLGKAQGALSKAAASKKADEDYLQTLNQDCTAKAQEWAARQEQATGEIGALTKGMEVLKGVKVLMQMQTKTVKMSNSEDPLRRRLMKVLKTVGQEVNSFAMIELTNSVARDPFKKVRGLIENMITKLQKQAKEEATHHAFCQEEQAKSKKSRDNKQSSVDKYSSRIESAEAALNQLNLDVADLGGELQEIDSATAKATKCRSDEKASFTKGEKDFKESVAAVAAAITALKDYYRGEGKASLLQQPSFQSSNDDAASMIIGILETAESDFAKTLAEMQTDESQAQAAYEKLIQENKVSKASKQAEVKGKKSESKSLSVSLASHKDDLSTANKELDAVLDYIEKLKPQCTAKVVTFAEKVAKRKKEMDGLKQALEILEVETEGGEEE